MVKHQLVSVCFYMREYDDRNSISHSDKFLTYCQNRFVSDIIVFLENVTPRAWACLVRSEFIKWHRAHSDLLLKFEFNS